MLVFELSMPNVGSWNGKWTGESNYYAKVRLLGRSKKAQEKENSLDGTSYYYSFGDGWGMNVSVRKIDAKESAKIRRISRGFMMYDWAIDSILKIGEIVTEDKLKEILATEKAPTDASQ